MSKIDKRITLKRTKPNPLFQSWLEKFHDEAIAKKSKLEPMLKEALASLSKYPLPLETGAECAILSGFNKNLCQFLDKCLETYNTNHSLKEKKRKFTINNEQPSTSQIIDNNNLDIINRPQCSATSQVITSHNLNNVEKSQCTDISEQPNNDLVIKTKEYKPAYRSGGYAILLALLEIFKLDSKQTTNKDDLIVVAQKYSEESFIRPKPESYYTAWSNMRKLITKGYVNKSGGKKSVFSLTDQGRNIAEKLLEESKTIPTTNDIIFNNKVNTSSFNNLENIEKTELIPTSTLECVGDTMQKTNQQNNQTVLIEMQPGTYDIILLIDKNETSGCNKNDPMVAQYDKYPDLNHEYRSLKVGDYTWIARHKVDKNQELVLPYIVERKRMDDLGASIKDGRFHEQKFRLRKCGLKNLIYMVENYGSNKYVGLPVHTLMQALANTRVQDNFKVHVTNSLTCSARFLAILTKRLTVEYKDQTLRGHDHEPSTDTLMTFDFFNKSSIKTKSLTVTDNFIKLLLQMKGVSVEKALAITNVYKTPSSLMNAYAGVDRKLGEMLLANLKYNNSRNVGPTTSKSIYQLFTLVDT